MTAGSTTSGGKAPGAKTSPPRARAGNGRSGPAAKKEPDAAAGPATAQATESGPAPDSGAVPLGSDAPLDAAPPVPVASAADVDGASDSTVDRDFDSGVEADVDARVDGDRPLLLHSLVELREVWLPVLAAAGVRSVVEIGSESGVATSLLTDALRRRGDARLVVIDPDPGVAPRSGGGLEVRVVRGYSPQALDEVELADAYFLDGDHNYPTVSAELAAIAAAADAAGAANFPLVLLHDVGWPAARRDQYYAPERIAPDQRRDHTWDEGVAVGNPGVVRAGFRGEGAFAWATTEGGPGNGVLTAVEDFLAGHPELSLRTVPVIFGLGLIVDERAPWAPAVDALLAPWSDNPLLARLERNRLDLYLRVLELQGEIAELSRARQRDWARVDAERSALAERELVTLERVGELERALHDERRTTEALKADLAARSEPSARAPMLRRR